MKSKLKRLFWFIVKAFILLACLIGLIILITSLLTEPSNDRDWSLDQVVLPYAEINNNLISIHNIRNFSYTSTSTYTPNYYDKTYNLEKIKRVWYVMEPFTGFFGSAHTFLSFEFEDNTFVAISIEIRKEKGEQFSAFKGLFNQYELMYVIGDERDLIKLRSNYRKDLVYLYPVKTTKEKAQELFLDMIERANTLKDKPEFYNSLTDTCTTNIVSHVNKITPERVPFSFKVLLPGYSDRLAYDLGLFDTTLSFEEARTHFLINEKAEVFANDPDFSAAIRREYGD